MGVPSGVVRSSIRSVPSAANCRLLSMVLCIGEEICRPKAGENEQSVARTPPVGSLKAFSCWRRCRPQAADVEGTPKDFLPGPVEWSARRP